MEKFKCFFKLPLVGGDRSDGDDVDDDANNDVNIQFVTMFEEHWVYEDYVKFKEQ